eukprot:TRINITY_DN5013_c0_g1_i8.p1 TRINITY_DN5013_c0_g1~~TRINITY_DN5013_c0_g1_i8.p1  ORF type:complete len:120 (+),score=34.39 TRINITY_DN5013_c0_g1_i8:6-365(+)
MPHREVFYDASLGQYVDIDLDLERHVLIWDVEEVPLIESEIQKTVTLQKIQPEDGCMDASMKRYDHDTEMGAVSLKANRFKNIKTSIKTLVPLQTTNQALDDVPNTAEQQESEFLSDVE